MLAEFAEPPELLLDVLTCADMTTGPDGSRVRATDRVSEILSRYPEDDPVHRASSGRRRPCSPRWLALMLSSPARKRRSRNVRLPQIWGVAVFKVVLDPQPHRRVHVQRRNVL